MVLESVDYTVQHVKLMHSLSFTNLGTEWITAKIVIYNKDFTSSNIKKKTADKEISYVWLSTIT